MKTLKKNVWVLFYIILVIGILILSFIIYQISKSEYKEYEIKQENITEVTKNSVKSSLVQYEMLMDFIIEQIKNTKDEKKIEKLLDYTIKLNPSILVSGIILPNGVFYISSTNSNKKKGYNLKQREETRKSFNYTLTRDEMVLGRSYYIKQFDKIMIPLRKVIKDENGKVIYVMTMGIDENKLQNLLSKNNFISYIFRDFDHFIQVINNNINDDLKVYSQKIPRNFIKSITTNKNNLSINTLKDNNTPMSFIFKDYYTKDAVLASILYIKRYNLFVITQIKKDIIEKEARVEISIAIGIFILIYIVLFILFKIISKSEMKKRKELYYQATHDYLTGLNNRKYLTAKFEEKKINEPFIMFFIDLDSFKSINDNYGHYYGDTVLKEVANRLNKIKQSNDTLVRYSGDEFLLIKMQLNESEISNISKKIIKEISRPYLIEEYEFVLGCSVGVSQYPKDSEKIDDIKRYADISMYEAKKDKNSFRVFDEKIKNKHFKNAQIEYELKSAIAKEEIYVVYQPQMDMLGNIYGVEALVRWENAKLGFIPPDIFIKIAETTGQMVPLGRYIMKTAIKQIKQVYERTGVEFQLSINISVKQFMEKEFLDILFYYLNKYDLKKESLTLEVTENVFIEDFNYVLKLFDKIVASGIKISLDDFGTGYSSLSLLKKLPIDELKIDKSFIDDILTDELSRNMVQSIISIGKNFNMEILAEGIENNEQKELLIDFGCDLFQGYYHSRPIKKEQLVQFIMDIKKDKL
ncbi:EAL domain-containing protein [Arcobacter sp. CECT 8985]|uniref:bifunctional diguanylate cyclase/phosphodiesterase n=1 Tax=Arcobacter sp. CECT 8985 TaxID=1935424 RepID=UPI00100AC2BD|nr:EAL domain-containing protein [Arcobacter sp. CECT 8985]RXJ83608.1 GGDEF-domain containing protein [Arcobacter sp. CECT 8985]